MIASAVESLDSRRLLIVLDLIPIVLQGGVFLGVEAGGIHLTDILVAANHAALFGDIVHAGHAVRVIGHLVPHDDRVARIARAQRARLDYRRGGMPPGTKVV